MFFQIRFGQHTDLIVVFGKQHSGHGCFPENRAHSKSPIRVKVPRSGRKICRRSALTTNIGSIASILENNSTLFGSSIRRILVNRGGDLGKYGNRHSGGFLMQLSSAIRAALIALTVAGAGLATAYADSGSIRFNVIKAGFVVGGSGGSGALLFHGRSYPLAIGGVSYGFTFGASATDFVGTVSNIRSPSDVNGVYAAAGAGAAVGPGAGGIVLTNQNGAVLTLAGRQTGLIVAADLNGLVITLR
jgi:hypothetical protein